MDATAIENEGMTANEVREILEHKRRRDEFAMAALPVVFSQAHASAPLHEVAASAYGVADAMIKARDA
jgi:hypothetical protein